MGVFEDDDFDESMLSWAVTVEKTRCTADPAGDGQTSASFRQDPQVRGSQRATDAGRQSMQAILAVVLAAMLDDLHLHSQHIPLADAVTGHCRQPGLPWGGSAQPLRNRGE